MMDDRPQTEDRDTLSAVRDQQDAAWTLINTAPTTCSG